MEAHVRAGRATSLSSATLAALFVAATVAACTPTRAEPTGVTGGKPTATAAPASTALMGLRLDMLEAVNRVRAQHSRAPLRLDQTLDHAAQVHAEDMARNGFMGHVGSDGSQPHQRLQRAGYRFTEYGENVAQGQVTVAETVADWMSSPSHRDIMLDPDLAELGVGYAEGPQRGRVPGRYWSIVLGRR